MVQQCACPPVPRSLGLTFDSDKESKGSYIMLSDRGSKGPLDLALKKGLDDVSSSSDNLRLYAQWML